MKDEFRKEWEPFIGPKRLNIGCGATVEPGWVNMDFNPQREDVITHDLRVRPWPFQRGEFDTVLASHILEHFRDEQLFGIMAEMICMACTPCLRRTDWQSVYLTADLDRLPICPTTS